MILYHGSNVIVRKPKIIYLEKGRDFGFGFYLTPIKDQAERMALRKCKIENKGKPIVSIFEWDENKKDIKFKKFNKANIEWLETIIQCRRDVKYKHGFDIIEGKIADDKVGETILFVMEGIIKSSDAINRLRFQRINSQIAFCSEKSLLHLSYKDNYEVKK